MLSLQILQATDFNRYQLYACTTNHADQHEEKFMILLFISNIKRWIFFIPFSKAFARHHLKFVFFEQFFQNLSIEIAIGFLFS
ncbi:MAG TPA: hypothetical protein DEQ24_07620 [Enterococcus sp.]|nr:hypothetical protein [Enterococcus sp.]